VSSFKSQRDDWLRFKEYHPDVDVVDDFSENEVRNPSVGGAWATYGSHQLVGCGAVTNSLCGKFRSHFGCLNVAGHAGKVWKGQDCTDKGLFRVVHYHCGKPQCPLCYEVWCAKQAFLIEARLLEASKRFGLVEHWSASVPFKLWDADPDVVRKYILKALEARGIIGGCLIDHFFRYDNCKGWYQSPHKHVLGFLLGGYGRCRNCKDVKCIGKNKEYLLCDGYEALTRRCFESDGVIVKVAEDKFGVKSERISVFETARYLLSHASIRTDVKRPHAYTWFGVCSYRKLKVTVEKRKLLCAICGLQMHKVRRAWSWNVNLDNYDAQCLVTDRDSPSFKREFLDVVWLNGSLVWVEDDSGSYAGLRRKF